MLIDYLSVRNLELVQNLQNPKSSQSLFGVLDQCQTPMGKRLLRANILQPSAGTTLNSLFWSRPQYAWSAIGCSTRNRWKWRHLPWIFTRFPPLSHNWSQRWRDSKILTNFWQWCDYLTRRLILVALCFWYEYACWGTHQLYHLA